mmetsp:Transcript_51865/g.137141  ORF Transcript_51865/g.137141 Transcript_51865/m.137141 type:complete len:163 (+) Transcript_51865:23-511(+)
MRWWFLGAAEVAASFYSLRKCSTRTCQSRMFPMLDFNNDTKVCTCRANPCKHLAKQCKGDTPYMNFHYAANKTLQCECTSFRVLNSVWVSKDICPGHKCENASAPLLDYSPHHDRCFCRPHPCSVPSVHSPGVHCPDPEFPELRYRFDDLDQIVCECSGQRL